MRAAWNAFLSPDPIDPFGGVGGSTSADWSDFDARKARYRLLSAFADQDAWRDRTLFAGFDAGTYRAIRDVLGVAFQLAEFWPSHIYAGTLDPRAGDGMARDSSIPIIVAEGVPDVPIREALAELWLRSQWAIACPTMVRDGTVQGDAFVEVCDDSKAGTIRLNVIPAGHVRECRTTSEGAVESYYLEYAIPNPDPKPLGRNVAVVNRQCRYEEIVEQVADGVRYQTFVDGKPYAWDGSPGADYVVSSTLLPFVPLVKVQHRNAGLGWGKSELAPAIGGMREVADLASCLTDWSRRVLNSPMLLSGVKNPADRPNANPVAVRQAETANAATWGTTGDNDAVRQQAPFLFAPPEARATSLTDPLPVDGIGGQIDRLRAKLIEDYPELAFEKIRLSGQASGESFREARKPAEDKIRQRRTEYDHASERAFRMALTMGGIRGYRHYEAFNLGSYEAGALDFSIDPGRPCFTLSQADKLANQLAKYQAMDAALKVLPQEIMLEEFGYDPDVIARAAKIKADQDELAMERQRRLMAGEEMTTGAEQ